MRHGPIRHSRHRGAIIGAITAAALAAVPVALARPGQVVTAFGSWGSTSTYLVTGGEDDAYPIGITAQPDGEILSWGQSRAGMGDRGVTAVRTSSRTGEPGRRIGNVFIDDSGNMGCECAPTAVAIGLSNRGSAFAGASPGRVNEPRVRPTIFVANGSGDPDPAFGVRGVVSFDPAPGATGRISSMYESGGRITVAGRAGGTWFVARLLMTGNLDPAFGAGGIQRGVAALDSVRIAAAPDGGVVLAGLEAVPDGGDTGRLTIARLTPAGVPDPAFGVLGVRTPAVRDLATQSLMSLIVAADGRIIVGGTTAGPVARRRLAVARLTAAGAPDGAFGNRGRVITAPGGLVAFSGGHLLIDAAKRVYLGGAGRRGAAGARYSVVSRFHTNGTPDVGFGAAGSHVSTRAGSDVTGLVLAPNAVVYGQRRYPDRRFDSVAGMMNLVAISR